MCRRSQEVGRQAKPCKAKETGMGGLADREVWPGRRRKAGRRGEAGKGSRSAGRKRGKASPGMQAGTQKPARET